MYIHIFRSPICFGCFLPQIQQTKNTLNYRSFHQPYRWIIQSRKAIGLWPGPVAFESETQNLRDWDSQKWVSKLHHQCKPAYTDPYPKVSPCCVNGRQKLPLWDFKDDVKTKAINQMWSHHSNPLPASCPKATMCPFTSQTDSDSLIKFMYFRKVRHVYTKRDCNHIVGLRLHSCSKIF